MSIIKKVLANVAQSLTRSEQTTAKKNIGLGDTAFQPPENGYAISAGALVWNPDHTVVYRLLEDWSYNTSWDNVTKKVPVAPGPYMNSGYLEGDPQCVKLSTDELATTVTGIYTRILAILRFGSPYLKLQSPLAEHQECDVLRFKGIEHSGSRVILNFDAIQVSVTTLSYSVIHINDLDYVDASSWTLTATPN